MIPLVDLRREFEEIGEEVMNEISKVFKKGIFVKGEEVEEFEFNFANFCQTKCGAFLSSGTSGLELALRGIGLKEGEEVITTPNTFIATVEAITHAKGRVVFVDIDEKTYNMEPNFLESKITPKTKAILPVHLFGQPCDMSPIVEIAKRHKLWIIEDACQAHGAKYKGKMVGSIGDVGVFSFYPSKNLGAYGNAGMVVSDNEEVIKRIKTLANHGRQGDLHLEEGFNFRGNTLQAKILSTKLKYLNKWNQRRRKLASLYNECLQEVEEIILPYEAPDREHVYHLYVIQTERREELKQWLLTHKIESKIHYPLPLHLQPAYSYLGIKKGSFPVAERVCKRILSLPIFPQLKEEEVHYISSVIKQFVNESR